MSFALDGRIEGSSAFVADLPLCQARLQDDARWPWLVLIPRRPGLREIEDLSAAERALLTEEIVVAGAAVRALAEVVGRPVEKLNVGALGNVAPQLHVHVLGRRRDDPAWPGPVWGFGTATAYADDARKSLVRTAAQALRRAGEPRTPPAGQAVELNR